MIFRKGNINFFFATFIFLLTDYAAHAQLAVNGTLTPTQLVQNVLLGSGVTASNITFTGSNNCRGSFNGANSNIGFTSGVLLTNGNLTNAIGPNNNPGVSVPNGLPGDVDLDAIMSPSLSYDATILEFDFVPTSDTVKFRYAFGSDEYMEYVSPFPGGINDGFGFFISGPGISGPFSNNSKNIALIPGTTLPVTMFNLNLNSNGAYYFDNGDGSGTGTAPDGATIQYDGFTVPLTAVAAVHCGQTYHIKIAIGDGGDDIIDSGVFLEAGSFSSHSISIIPHISYGGPNDSTLYEGCGTACIYFVRGSTISTADTVSLIVSGTAINGTDYYVNSGGPGTPLPSQIIFAPGHDSISFCISAVSDGVIEGLESIILTVPPHGTGFCLQPAASAKIYLNEPAPISLTTNNDTILNCVTGPVHLFVHTNGGIQPYGYSWSNGAGSVAAQTVTPSSNTVYTVTVSDACTGNPDPTPNVTDSIRVTLNIPLPLGVNAGSDITTCPENTVNLNATTSGGAQPLTYLWTSNGTDSIHSAGTASVSVFAISSALYTISLSDNCGNTASDKVAVNVEQNCLLIIPNVVSPDGQGSFINEIFHIENLERFPLSSLVIYNRWGNKIFETSGYQNNWNGSKYSEGTYYYVLTIPTGGQGAAKVKPSAGSRSYKDVTTGNSTVFAGFFQIVKSK